MARVVAWDLQELEVELTDTVDLDDFLRPEQNHFLHDAYFPHVSAALRVKRSVKFSLNS